MGIIQAIAKRFGYVKSQPASPPPFTALVAGRERDGLDPYFLASSNALLYERLSWVQQSVSRVAQTAATTPLRVLYVENEVSKEISAHPFEMLLQRPNPMDSAFELMVRTFSYLLVSGNAYWWINAATKNAPPDEIWVLPSQFVEPLPDEKLWIRGYRFDTGHGPPIEIEPSEIVHFKMFNPHSSYVGLSPLSALRTVSRSDIRAQDWHHNFYAESNAKPAGALAFSDPIADPEWMRMQEEIKAQHGGTRRSLLMLRSAGSGVQWLPMAFSQSDMQFLESREFTKSEIYEQFAPGLLSMTSDSSTEASSKTGYKVFLEMGVYPLLVLVAQKITNDLLPRYGDNLVAAYDDIRPSDRELRLKEIETATSVLTINEIRTEYYQRGELPDRRGEMIARDRLDVDVVGTNINKAVKADVGSDLSADELRVYERLVALFEEYRTSFADAIEQSASVDNLIDQLRPDVRAVLIGELVSVASDALLKLEQEFGLPADEATQSFVDWWVQYCADVAAGIAKHTSLSVHKIAQKFREAHGMTRAELETLLAPTLGLRRAEAIAITEVTRAQNQAVREYQVQAKDTLGVDFERVWRTNADDLVCPICAPLNGKPESEWGRDAPPAHPRCRCTTSLRLRDAN